MRHIEKDNLTTFWLLVLAFVAFISLGLPDGLLGVAWPGVRKDFAQGVDAMGIVLLFGLGGYLLSSFFSGFLTKNLGIGVLLAGSCGAIAITLFVYALVPIWPLFILFTALSGAGAGGIDAGINNYVVTNFSPRVMQWLHASFGIGITLGPIVMTIAIGATSKWQIGYLYVAIAQGVLAVVFFATRDIWKDKKSSESSETQRISQATIGSTLINLPTIFSMLLFFLYTGVELGFGLWIYTLLTESRVLDPQIAGVITGAYWAMFTLGRFLAGWYLSKAKVKKLIFLSIFLASFGLFLVLINLGQIVSILGVVITGFAVAPIYPGLTSDTLVRVGEWHHTNTIGMQVASAGLGGALLPSVFGVIARIFGLEAIVVALLVSLLLFFLIFLFFNLKSNI